VNDSLVGILGAVVAALGGAGGIAAIIKQLASAAKTRAEAKQASQCGHQATQEMLAAVSAAVREQLAAALADNAVLRAQLEAKEKRVARLEKELAVVRARAEDAPTKN